MSLPTNLFLSLCITCCIVDARSKPLLNEQNQFTTSYSTMRQVDNDFDCVDIYKQDALQHPLLKNHKIQLYPTFAKNVVQSRRSNDGECPVGKTPIYKGIRKHQFDTNSSSKLQSGDLPIGYHTISLDTTKDCINGGYAAISIYNLSLSVGQYSSSLICVASGQPNENNICAGLSVYPALYGDSQPRITTQWLDGTNRDCIDKRCSGFVQVTQDKPYIGVVRLPSTPIGEEGKKIVVNVKIQRDNSTGNWWLTLDEIVQVGYWPKELFPHLSEGASLVRFMGQVYASPNLVNPPMGSGKLPKEGYANAALFGKLMTIDSESTQSDVEPEDMKPYSDANSDCYDLLYYKYSGPKYRQAFLFGGPGGQNCDK
ncbi:unnamed protein product [Trifolium pratense]|uniref:Uncharacterized protein n=1 Tax=Trifolium pratense TaxID=57577 RepID=A0ACB0L6N5_TRIPR|nr:unnamed protein product [Trifolium pratense]